MEWTLDEEWPAKRDWLTAGRHLFCPVTESMSFTGPSYALTPPPAQRRYIKGDVSLNQWAINDHGSVEIHGLTDTRRHTQTCRHAESYRHIQT